MRQIPRDPPGLRSRLPPPAACPCPSWLQSLGQLTLPWLLPLARRRNARSIQAFIPFFELAERIRGERQGRKILSFENLLWFLGSARPTFWPWHIPRGSLPPTLLHGPSPLEAFLHRFAVVDLPWKPSSDLLAVVNRLWKPSFDVLPMVNPSRKPSFDLLQLVNRPRKPSFDLLPMVNRPRKPSSDLLPMVNRPRKPSSDLLPMVNPPWKPSSGL